MGSFNNYLRLGYEHIVNLNGLDHIIFILALMAAFQPKSWLKIVFAVSIFTLGHSLTLSLSAFDLIEVDKKLIEFAIPVTIMITAIFNLTKAGQKDNPRAKYWIAGIFGMIHGLGFANYYNMLTLGETTYWSALLPFNLGVELGQLLTVMIVLVGMVIFQLVFNVRHQSWNLFFSGGAFAIATLMSAENWPF